MLAIHPPACPPLPSLGRSQVAQKKDAAVKKLQAIFRAKFAQRMRAEAKLFGMLKECTESLTNHWNE